MKQSSRMSDVEGVLWFILAVAYLLVWEFRPVRMIWIATGLVFYTIKGFWWTLVTMGTVFIVLLIILGGFFVWAQLSHGRAHRMTSEDE